MSNEYPWSEQYRLAAEDWVDKEAAAQLLEDTKSSLMAQKQAMQGDIAVNKAEQNVKASRDWINHIEKIVEARKQANLAKINLDVIKMKYYESQSREATQRVETRMLGSIT